MYITHISDTSSIVRSPSGNSINWMLTAKNGAPNFELRYIEIPVGGKTSFGEHAHEHEVFIVKGLGRVQGKDLSGKPFTEALEHGNAVFIQGHEEHQWVNVGSEPLGLICVIPIGAEDQYKPASWK